MMHPNHYPNGKMVIPTYMASISNVTSTNNPSDTTSLRSRSKKGRSKTSPRGRSASISSNMNDSIISDGGGDDDDDDDDDDGGGGGNGDLNSRLTRNQREQKRSLKISEQIDMLGKLLSVNGIDVKVNKYNILSKVSDYIRELQEKTALAIKSNDNNFTASSSSSSLPKGAASSSSSSEKQSEQLQPSIPLRSTHLHMDGRTSMSSLGDKGLSSSHSALKQENIDSFHTGNIAVTKDSSQGQHGERMELSDDDFCAVFHWCAVPWALARVDGRICDCNESFVRVSGYSKAELVSFTFFNLIHPSELQETFSAVGSLLTNYHSTSAKGTESHSFGASSSSSGHQRRRDHGVADVDFAADSDASLSIRRRAKLHGARAQELNYTFSCDVGGEGGIGSSSTAGATIGGSSRSSSSSQRPSKLQRGNGSSRHQKAVAALAAATSATSSTSSSSAADALDIVVTLVRAPGNHRPSYFHVRLVPARVDSPTRNSDTSVAAHASIGMNVEDLMEDTKGKKAGGGGVHVAVLNPLAAVVPIPTPLQMAMQLQQQQHQHLQQARGMFPVYPHFMQPPLQPQAHFVDFSSHTTGEVSSVLTGTNNIHDVSPTITAMIHSTRKKAAKRAYESSKTNGTGSGLHPGHPSHAIESSTGLDGTPYPYGTKLPNPSLLQQYYLNSSPNLANNSNLAARMYSLASATNGNTAGMQGISGLPVANSNMALGDMFYSLADYGFVPTMNADMIIGDSTTNLTEERVRSNSALDFLGMSGNDYEESTDHAAATTATTATTAAAATAVGNRGNHTAAVSKERNNKTSRMGNSVSTSSTAGAGTFGGMWEGREGSSNCTYDNIFDDFLASDIMPQSQP